MTFQGDRKTRGFGSTGYEMVVGTHGRDMFKVRVQRSTEDTKFTIDVDVCLEGSAVRKKTTQSDVISKIIDWVRGCGQEIINK